MAPSYRVRHGSTAENTTFTPPPLDGSLTLPQLYAFHATHSPTHPLFVFENGEGSRTITWAEMGDAIGRAQNILQTSLGEAKKGEVIAVLANADTVSYLTFSVAALLRGHTLFPISIRNSPQGVAQLLTQTRAKRLFISSGTSVKELADNAEKHLEETVPRVELPLFEQLFEGPKHAIEQPEVGLDDTALILHSSGSTAFPKIRPLTNRILLEWTRTPCYGEIDMCGHTISVHSSPMFHASGWFHTSWAPSTGLTLSVYPPLSPPVTSDPTRLLESVARTNCTLLFAVPSFLEAWSKSEEQTKQVAALQKVVFGGGPLSGPVGDVLFNAGVKLTCMYGATEYGLITKFVPKKTFPEGWLYLQFADHVSAELRVPEEGAENERIFELILVEHEFHHLSDHNTSSLSGGKAYATSDLLQLHESVPIPSGEKQWTPPKGFLFTVHGRTDDQIMLSTGEKTNPAPLEHLISKHPSVATCLMFGRARFQNGLLVQPARDKTFDPKDVQKLAAFRNEIWDAVEEANAFAPTHSRIFKEMIIVTDPSNPVQYSPKGTPLRASTIAAYTSAIDELYAYVESSAASAASSSEKTPLPPTPDFENQEETERYVHALISSIMRREVAKDEDIFVGGCDSLQATFIRHAVLSALRDSEAGKRVKLPPNFVYASPSVVALAQAIGKKYRVAAQKTARRGSS